MVDFLAGWCTYASWNTRPSRAHDERPAPLERTYHIWRIAQEHASHTFLLCALAQPRRERVFSSVLRSLFCAQAMFVPVNQKRLPRLRDHEVELYAQSTQMGAYDLVTAERYWQDCQPHLQRHGYLLRPRYSPGWKPSWLGTNLDPTFCEDSITSIVGVASRHNQEFIPIFLIPP